MLFPGFGYYDTKMETWRALVHGRVFRGGRIPLGTRLLLKGLKAAMQASPEQLASETFQERIGGFLTAPGKRRRIVLETAGKSYRLRRRTRRNGAFYGRITLPSDAIPSPGDSSNVIAESLRLDIRGPEQALATGQIFITPPTGISIISDIDDTIKYTDATRRKEMLANTFLRPFTVIEGMAQLYKKWHNAGCLFHYVSSSPWQLYPALAELCTDSDFPNGSMHLRYFRVRDEMFKRFRRLRRNNKVAIIAGILRALPERKFVLIGDSGEQDPEIYRFLARRFPDQVTTIAIRNLAARPVEGRRLEKLSTVSSHTQIRIFVEPEELSDLELSPQL
ncbi:MAG: hypothetical protein Aurels2KO_23640 [Aureliella sp.]